MKKVALSYIVIAALAVATVFTSCEKIELVEIDVYMAGSEGNYAVVWINGIPHDLLPGGTNFAVANSVYVSDYDEYVAGYVNNSIGAANRNIATLWINGEQQYLADNTLSTVATSVFVSGSDVYVTGYVESTSGLAMLWKNGVRQNLKIGGISSEAHSVYISNGDVYVAGNQGKFAVIWKNGEQQNLTDGINMAVATSVFVSKHDVYVTGYEEYYEEGRETPVSAARLWKNGIIQNLSDREEAFGGSGGSATSVYVSGNDVYVTGIIAYTARLWKNGVVQNLAAADRNVITMSNANSVYVFGNDVYVAGGHGGKFAALWNNGILHHLTDGSFSPAKANSVFVLKK